MVWYGVINIVYYMIRLRCRYFCIVLGAALGFHPLQINNRSALCRYPLVALIVTACQNTREPANQCGHGRTSNQALSSRPNNIGTDIAYSAILLLCHR